MSAVEEIKEALETSMHIHGSKAMQHAEELDALRAKVAELDAEIERLRRERDALRQDAERYRCARDRHKDFAIMQNIGHDWTRLEPNEADAAIDAARAREGK